MFYGGSDLNDLSEGIIGCAIEVHRELGQVCSNRSTKLRFASNLRLPASNSNGKWGFHYFTRANLFQNIVQI